MAVDIRYRNRRSIKKAVISYGLSVVIFYEKRIFPVN